MEITDTRQDDNASRREARNDALKNLAFVVLVVIVAYGITISIGIDGLKQIVARAGVWGPLAVIVMKMTTIIFVPLSGGPVYAIAGAAFGFWKGFIIASIGDVLGFATTFYLSRIFGRKIIDTFIPRAQYPFVDKLLTQGSATRSFLKARLAFVGFPEVFSYAAGLTTIPFFIFIVAQMALHIPASAFVVLFGNALLTDNPFLFAGAAVVATILAIIGGWWFKHDLLHEA